MSAEESARYLAVIDAGSSGTRLTLYGDDATLVPRELTVARAKTRGLSSFASPPAQAGPKAVDPLLEQLDDYLSAQGISRMEVPVALLATAGLRNLQRDNTAAADAILRSTADTIKGAGHPIADNRILPAVQEATLAWLDTNALAGTLEARGGGISIIEAGGASAQVAFRSPVAEGPGVHQVTAAGRTFSVVSVSYLGLGGNDERTLMQRASDAGSFCFPNNAGGADPSTYLSSSERPVDASRAQFAWSRCAAAYDAVIASVGETPAAEVPPRELRDLPGFASARFVGLGSLIPITGTLGIQQAPNEKKALRAAVTRTCSGPDAWPRTLNLYSDAEASFAETVCSTGTFQHEFVFGSSGVGVKPGRFSTDSSTFPHSPSWTEGYAITVLDP